MGVTGLNGVRRRGVHMADISLSLSLPLCLSLSLFLLRRETLGRVCEFVRQTNRHL